MQRTAQRAMLNTLFRFQTLTDRQLQSPDQPDVGSAVRRGHIRAVRRPDSSEVIEVVISTAPGAYSGTCIHFLGDYRCPAGRPRDEP
jgi:hypothetical protein